MTDSSYIIPHWPAPSNVRALTTTRQGGFSQGAFDSFNLGMHVNDDPAAVEKNRGKLQSDLAIEHPIQWLNQTHSTNVIYLDVSSTHTDADACITQTPYIVCSAMTADCLPLLVCNRQGTEVAAIHAGWRGLLNGIIDNTIKAMQAAPEDLLVWLGPAIGPTQFEINTDIQQAFCHCNKAYADAFKIKGKQLLADLYQLARTNLSMLGVQHISGGDHCSYSEPELFYSYRRDQQTTGRIASLIWLIDSKS